MSIHDRLLTIEQEFLSAISVGEEAVSFFEGSWSALQTDIDTAVTTNAVDDGTLALAHTVASNIAALASRFLDFDQQCEEMTSDLRTDIEEIFAEVRLTDNGSTPHAGGTPSLSSRFELNQHHDRGVSRPPVAFANETLSSPCPPYVAPAYKWLVKNIHNPYPSHDVRILISKQTNTPLKTIDAWFVNVRRRMGWTALSRQFFHGCRSDTIDAAYRALVQEDSKRQLDPKTAHAFMVVKVTAEGLYSSKFKKSALAGQLDIVVKDMTDEDRLRMEKMKLQEAKELKQRKEVEKEMRRQERARKREALKAALSASKSYPSPVGSPYESPVPALEDSFTDESEDEEDYIAFTQTSSGNKRRASSSSASAMSTPPRHDDRPLKRHRSDSKEPEIVAIPSISALPSPPSEVDIANSVFGYWSPEVVELPVALSVPSLPAPAQSHNRKRRLSDGAAQGAPKRPRGLVGPRLHAVSDPLPKTNESTDEFNAWLMGNFEIPPAVADEVPDPSTLLDVEVECYDWSSMQDCYSLPVDDIATLASPPYSTQTYNPFNMDPNPFSVTDINPLSIGGDLGELYNIFGINSHNPPPYSSQPVDDATSSLTCVASDSGITLAPSPMSFSDNLFSDGGAWSNLPSYTDAVGSFNPSSTHSSIPESTDPLNFSSILSEIDLSMLQLPTTSPADILRQSEEAARLADKQAKLEQLRMLEEAKRRLEAELASDV